MNIFKQPYTLRRYKSQQWVKGYARSEYEDSTFMLCAARGRFRGGQHRWPPRGPAA